MKQVSLAVRSLQRFGLRNKDIVYAWDQPADQKTKTFYTEGELASKQKMKMKNRMKEDYRIHLLGIKKQKEIEKPIEDEIFGLDKPESKRFDSANITEIYRKEKARDADEFISAKLSYIPEFLAPYGQVDPKVEDMIVALKGLIQTVESHHANIQDEYILREKIFEDKEIQAAMADFKAQIGAVNFNYFPSLISKICFELKYNDEYIAGLGIYRLIENKLTQSLHLYSIEDLAQIQFGLTYKMPKMGSLGLRQNIKSKITEKNFNVLAPEQVLRIYTAFRNELNCQKVHLKCIEYLFDQREKVEKQLSQDPNLAIKVLYTYMNSRPAERYRRQLLEENEIENETDKITNLYVPLALDHISHIKKNDFLRLLSCVYTLKLKDYEELYVELENYYLENANQFNNNEKTSILYYFARCNNDRGIGSRDFWKTVVENHLGSSLPTNNLQVSAFCRLVYSLVASRAINLSKFEKIFGQHLLAFLGSEELNFSEASQLAATLVILDTQGAKLEKYFKSFIKNVSTKKEWVPLRYYYHLKFFTNYCRMVQPNWDVSIIESLFYHAEKKFNTYHSRKEYVIPEYKDLSSVVSRLDTYLLSFMDYKNLFLIDYCIEERKLAVLYLTDRDYLYDLIGGTKILNPLTEIKLRLLEKDEYVVCSIDHEEFTAIKENKSDWLKQKLEDAYKLTEVRAREIHFLNQKAITDRIFGLAKAEMNDDRYLDLKTKSEILEENHIELIEGLKDINK